MKLKPFNLEEWKKDTGQAVYTMDGHEVLQLHYFETICNFSLCGILKINSSLYIWDCDSGNIYFEMINDEEEADTYSLMLVDKDSLDEVEQFINEALYISNVAIKFGINDSNPKHYYAGKKELAQEILEFIKGIKEKGC